MIAKGERGLRCRIAFRGGDKRTRRALRDSLRGAGLDVVVEANGPYGTAVTIWHEDARIGAYALQDSLNAVLAHWPRDLLIGPAVTATVARRRRTR